MGVPSAAVPRMVYFTVRRSGPVACDVTVSSFGAGPLSLDFAALNFQVPAQGSPACAKAKAPVSTKAKNVSFFIWVPPHENIFPEARAGCKAASALRLIEPSISLVDYFTVRKRATRLV